MPSTHSCRLSLGMLLCAASLAFAADTASVTNTVQASPVDVAPQRYCNPMPLPNYPVGRMARDIKLGAPLGDPGHWRLKHQEQYRELADPTALWHGGKWFVYPSCDMAWVSEDEGLTWQHHPLNIRDIGYAPSIVRHGERFLLIASDSDLYTASSPLGPFTSLGRLQTPKTPGIPGQTDPMLFSDDDGRLYYYWGCTARDGIWAVELDTANPVRVISQPRQVIPFEPDRHPWERLGFSPRTKWTITKGSPAMPRPRPLATGLPFPPQTLSTNGPNRHRLNDSMNTKPTQKTFVSTNQDNQGVVQMKCREFLCKISTVGFGVGFEPFRTGRLNQACSA